jgi:PIN domain nuclease of toxin-antitoxin system
MGEYVLDTHACVFALEAPKKLGRRARTILEESEIGRHVLWIPVPVVAEIIMLRELGRIDLSVAELKAAMEEAASLRFLPLDLSQLDEFSALTAIRDPFDRLVVSAARARRAKLISRDELLSEHGLVEVIWS